MSQLKKILVVDDNKVNRQILRKILSPTYEVLEAENGQEALKLLYELYEHISAVLLDLVMPIMDGYEVLKKVQKDDVLSKIPIIVTTGSDNQCAEVRALSLGAHDFLVKPYKPEVILHRLKNTVNLRETAALVNAIEKDELTGVYNKEFFYKKAEMILKEKSHLKYDIVCMDIERFKLINDLFGMKAGDKLLQYVADIARNQVKDIGICGRIGADEFAFLIPHRDTYHEEMFTSIIEAVNQFPINVSVNIYYGIYSVHNILVPINVMCDRAMIACHSVKGKYDIHYAFYTDSLRESLLSEQTIVDGMKEALKEKQFEIYYQPKYDLSTETIAGAEALVRWNHPKKGFMTPDEFIPLFEKNGFIIDLDMYIWEAVCMQIRYWMDNDYLVFPISVNVSRTDIYNPNLEKILIELTKKYDIDHKSLHLEITETAYTENPEQIISTVTQLRNHGFIIEMDDFGSGYSSLNMLSELPIHVLKLDMQFIKNETSKKNHKNILSFIVSLAKWLDLQVVAEGVETSQQVEILKSMDCNYAQGYFYAKPMPKNDFEKLLSHCKKSESFQEPQKVVPKEIINIQKSQSDRVMVIVDDSEINRAILTKIFRNLYNIVEASDGKSAFEFIKNNYKEIDIVLLDLVMPIMNGFQMLEKIKSDENLKNIPVIITSQPGENSEARALSMRAADFIAKPYSQEVSLRRVSNVMAQSKLRMLEREQELAREVEEMRYKAEHDYLTGLYNRTAMETKINSFFAKNEKANSTFFMLDVDCFKVVNDTFGHNKGDELLIRISDILVSCFREDDIVARFGGDEFAVFVPYAISPHILQKRAQKICDKLTISLGDIMVSASIGICNSPLYGADYQTLYRNADSALLVAKRLGKNQYKIFDNQMEMPSPLMHRNMEWLLDETSDAIVICNPTNYEILYLNNVAAKLSQMDKKLCVGEKCYKALWKRDRPCEHCIAFTKLSKEYIKQEVDDKRTNKHYIIRDKITEWGGKIARIQYIQDDTERNKIWCELQQNNKKNYLLSSSFQFCLDEEWMIINADDQFYEIIGYSREEFEKKFNNCMVSVLEPTYYEMNKQQILQQKTKDKILLESCFVDKNGELVYIYAQIMIAGKQDEGSCFYWNCIQKKDSQDSIKEKDEGLL